MKKSLTTALISVAIMAATGTPGAVMAAPVETPPVGQTVTDMQEANSQSLPIDIKTTSSTSDPRVEDIITLTTVITGIDSTQQGNIILNIPLSDCFSYISGGTYHNGAITFTLPKGQNSVSVSYRVKAIQEGKTTIGENINIQSESQTIDISKKYPASIDVQKTVCPTEEQENTQQQPEQKINIKNSKTNTNIIQELKNKPVKWSMACLTTPKIVEKGHIEKITYTLVGNENADNIRLVLTVPYDDDFVDIIGDGRLVRSKADGKEKILFDIKHYQKGDKKTIGYIIKPTNIGKQSVSDIELGLLNDEQFKDQTLTDESSSAQKWTTKTFSKDYHYTVINRAANGAGKLQGSRVNHNILSAENQKQVSNISKPIKGEKTVSNDKLESVDIHKPVRANPSAATNKANNYQDENISPQTGVNGNTQGFLIAGLTLLGVGIGGNIIMRIKKKYQ